MNVQNITRVAFRARECMPGRGILALGVATWALAATAASAQSVSQPPKSATSAAASSESAPVERGALEDIVVTARRQSESLLDVPVTVSAVPGSELAKKNVTDFRAIAHLVPAVSMAEEASGNGATFTIRGIGTPPLDPGLEQSVLLMIDGTPITRGRMVLAGMFDLGQVEVLKGPQALFFGKNSPAGVISLSSAAPTDKLSGYVRGGYEFEAREKYVDAAVSGTLAHNLTGRIAIHFTDMDGWLKNVATPLASPLPAANLLYFPVSAGAASKRLPGTRQIAGRATLKWEPTSNFDATFRVTAGNRQDNGIPVKQYCDPSVHSGPGSVGGFEDPNGTCLFSRNVTFGGVPAQFVTPEWRLANGGIPYQNLDTVFSSLTMNYKLNNATVTSVTSYWDLDYSQLGGYDYTSYGLADSAQEEKSHSISQELRLVTNFDKRLNFSAGAYYENVHRTNINDLLLFFLGPVAAGQPGAGRYDTYDLQLNSTGRTLSGFGQMRLKLLEKVELGAGVRYTNETRTQRDRHLFIHPLAQVFIGGFVPVGQELNGKFEESNWSPEVSLSYKPTSNLLIYGAFKTGYKSGGFPSPLIFRLNGQGQVPDPRDVTFRGEKASGGEIGFKAQLADRRVRVEGTAYLYNYKGLQESIYIPELFDFKILNAANARVKGIELQADVAATRNLRLNGSIAYNIARYTSFPNAPCFVTQTLAQGCDVNNHQDLTGRTLPRAPKVNVVTGASYDMPITSNLSVEFSGDVSYRSHYVTQETQPAMALQHGFALWNAGVRLYSADERYEIAFIGRNLGNKNYVELSTAATFGLTADQLQGSVPRGRELRVQLGYKF